MNTWFEVDKEGLAKLVERRGKVFVLHELLQNAWDCDGTTTVEVTLKAVPNHSLVQLSIIDDHPDGFRNLAHAYTLFAESEKKAKGDKRGRFNLGEKLVLSLCEKAILSSTTGTVLFEKDGRRHQSRLRRKAGTSFTADVRMTREELGQVLSEVKKIVPPTHIKTFINEELISSRQSLLEFDSTLQTEIAGDSGHLSRPYRNTIVTLYKPNEGEKPTLFEMGIPVMELGDDPYHIDVGQKIPMGMERDAVSAQWLKTIRGAVLDNSYELLNPETAAGRWTGDALEESENHDAIKSVITQRFGDKVVIADPSDREGENIAKAQGYTVIPGGSFTAWAWSNIKSAEAALPAGQVTPSPKPFSANGKPLKLLDPEKWTPQMRDFVDFAKWIISQTTKVDVEISITKDIKWPFGAAYSKTLSGAHLIFNAGRLGFGFFISREAQVNLLIHELAHQYGHHLEESYHEALCTIGTQIAFAAIASPSRFQST